MRTLTQIRAHFRELIGGRSQSEVSDRTAETFINDAIDCLADKLDYVRRNDTASFALVAGQYEYPVPSDVNEVQYFQWDNKELKKSTIEEWTNYGVNWRGAASGTPAEIAHDGRTFIVYPPPSANAITTDGKISYRFIATGLHVTEAGIPQLPDSDVRIVTYLAAQMWCLANPEMPGNQQRANNFEIIIARRFQEAEARHQRPIRDYYPTIGGTTAGGGTGR